MTNNLTTIWERENRDLLIELRTEMKGVRGDIQELTDGSNARLGDHEARIRGVEEDVRTSKTKVRTLLAIGSGVFAIFQVIVQVGINFIKH